MNSKIGRLSEVQCEECGKIFTKPNSQINRTKKRGWKNFCGYECAGLHKRKLPIGKAERKRRQREYSKRWISKTGNRERVNEKIREYRLTNPDRARATARKASKKCAYKKRYGEFWQAAIMLNQLRREIDSKIARRDNQLTHKRRRRANES